MVFFLKYPIKSFEKQSKYSFSNYLINICKIFHPIKQEKYPLTGLKYVVN
jgi:hypothetical protein